MLDTAEFPETETPRKVACIECGATIPPEDADEEAYSNGAADCGRIIGNAGNHCDDCYPRCYCPDCDPPDPFWR